MCSEKACQKLTVLNKKSTPLECDSLNSLTLLVRCILLAAREFDDLSRFEFETSRVILVPCSIFGKPGNNI